MGLWAWFYPFAELDSLAMNSFPRGVVGCTTTRAFRAPCEGGKRSVKSAQTVCLFHATAGRPTCLEPSLAPVRSRHRVARNRLARRLGWRFCPHDSGLN